MRKVPGPQCENEKVQPVNFLRQLAQGIAKAWKELSLTARVNIVAGGVAVMVLMAVTVYFGARPQYVTLTSTADSQKITQVTDLLDQEGVAYVLQDDNQTIRIPHDRLSTTQLLLAKNELPVGRSVPPGWELFAENELMTNQWNQDVKFMRAVQGELQRQINAFDFVSYSYVLIREAKQELFVSEQLPSEASVTLETTRPLTREEIKGIVSMVSRAGGANLHPGNITVVDTAGTILHMPPQSDYVALASSRYELAADVERERENKLMSKLKELGVRGTVSVSARLDFDELEETTEQVLEGAELSSFTMSTSITSTESLPEGAPGAFANVPEAGAAPGGTNTSEETTEEIINYEPSRLVRTKKTNPGDVVKYLVTMVVEGDTKEVTDDEGNTTTEYVPLTEVRKKVFEDLAMATVGEGSVPTMVTVHDQPIEIDGLAATAAAMQELASARRWEQMIGYAWTAAQIFLILLAFIILRRLLQRAIVSPTVEEVEEEVYELSPEEQEALRRNRISQELSTLSTQDPAMVAALLRSWLVGEEE